MQKRFGNVVFCEDGFKKKDEFYVLVKTSDEMKINEGLYQSTVFPRNNIPKTPSKNHGVPFYF